ncbi:hypothetical protein [Thalassotalea sp. ND16A]|uniref:hypothetical protein n=1 Tax=Thalassotalea sp. ND16A TaxID=1535422 RepID=UPI00051DD98D|nr:hypothetical protein [Thalassotalea sp. ND16A]KGJ90257.1 hypothetical protein ND16A_1987 [Thalassotalea sp. ND16A]
MLKTFFIGMFIYITCFSVFSSDVFIETDMEFGRGMLRQVGSTCLVYTPKHVIEDSESIYISGRFKRDIAVSLLTQYPQDLAVLSVPSSDTELCRESTWRDGARVSAILNSLTNAKLSFRKKNGGLTEYDLIIVEKEIHTYFHIKLSSSKKTIKQGMSGSTVYVGDYPIGILVSVKDGVGKVLRLDDITNISQSVVSTFETEAEKISRESGLVTRKTTPTTQAVAPSSTDQKEQIFQGEIAEGTVKVFNILSKGNTAYKLTNLKQSNSVLLSFEFLSPGEQWLYRSGNFTSDKKKEFGFGTQEVGEHILKISGNRGVGSFSLKLEEVATPEELTGEANIIGHNDIAKGFISSGTVAYYRIFSKGNTAYKLTNLKQSNSVLLSFEFLSPGEQWLYRSGNFTSDKKKEFGFGTQEVGEHILKISGNRGVGSFSFKLEEVSTKN